MDAVSTSSFRSVDSMSAYADTDPVKLAKTFCDLTAYAHGLELARRLIKDNKEFLTDLAVFDPRLKKVLSNELKEGRITHALNYCRILIELECASSFIHAAYIACLTFNKDTATAKSHQSQYPSLCCPVTIEQVTNLLKGKQEHFPTETTPLTPHQNSSPPINSPNKTRCCLIFWV